LVPALPPPFPYTTLFRSVVDVPAGDAPRRPRGGRGVGASPLLYLPGHGGPAPGAPPARPATRRRARVRGRGRAGLGGAPGGAVRSEEHTSELQSPDHLVC